MPDPMLPRPRTVALAVSALALMLSACSSNRSAASSSVAERFYQAVAADNGSAACALLAPPTLHEVEQSEGKPCADALLDEDIPAGGAVTALHVYGTEAQVRMSNDTAFLAEFDDGWKVMAAACTAKGELPYDCKLKG